MTNEMTFVFLHYAQEPVTPDFTTPVDVANINLSRPKRIPKR